jgi:hypothetical protein
VSTSEAKTKKDLDIEKGHHSFDIISNKEILEFHIDYWEQSKAPPFCQRQLHQQPAHDREIRHYRSKPNSWRNLIGTVAPAHSSTVFSKQIRAANAGSTVSKATSSILSRREDAPVPPRIPAIMPNQLPAAPPHGNSPFFISFVHYRQVISIIL